MNGERVYTSAAELVADIERLLATGDREALRGQLEGLLGAEPGGSGARRAGILTGRLCHRLLEDGRDLDGALMLAAGVYAANVAQADRLPVDDQALIKEHTVGCIRVAKRGHELDEPTELSLLRWLAGESGIAVTSELHDRWMTMRARRLAARRPARDP